MLRRVGYAMRRVARRSGTLLYSSLVKTGRNHRLPYRPGDSVGPA